MKLSLITCALLLCSCAVGTTDPLVTDEPVTVPAYPRPSPPPPPDAGSEMPSNCHVDTSASGNCEITVLICDNQIKDIEIRCGVGRKLFPWEYIPDPPPPWVDSNPRRK